MSLSVTPTSVSQSWYEVQSPAASKHSHEHTSAYEAASGQPGSPANALPQDTVTLSAAALQNKATADLDHDGDSR